MFSNGTEHMTFMDNQCYRCRRYVDWEDDPQHVCPIEDAISRAGAGDKDAWPTDKLERHKYHYTCKGFVEGDPGTDPEPDPPSPGQLTIEEVAAG